MSVLPFVVMPIKGEIMDISTQFTVLHDGQFYIGIFEKHDNQTYLVKKLIFGTEPNNEEIYNFIKTSYHKIEFENPLITENLTSSKKINPKRVQKIISAQLKEKKISTKAQSALKAQQELNKKEKKENKSILKKQTKERNFELKQIKKKAKKKGR